MSLEDILKNKKIFISTIPPLKGGVPQMLKNLLNVIGPLSSEIVIGYYQPRSLSPELSVTSWQLPFKTIKEKTYIKDSIKYVEIGCYLPEFENFNYYPTKIWKKVYSECRLLLLRFR